MLPFLWIILSLIGLPPAGPDDTADPIAELRIVSYNIHHGRGTDGSIDLERTARVIRSASPDLVALQEVDVNTKRSGGVNQVEELARLTDMEYVFGDNLDYRGGDYGNAVLSRLPVSTYENHRLPNLKGPPRRSALETVISLDGRPVGFLSAHLDYKDTDNRLGEVRAINRLLDEKDVPMILAGDLNARFDSKTLKLFATSWTHTTTEPRHTFPAEDPTRQIDFVLVHPEARWRVTAVRVLDAPTASDHRPLLVVLELLPE